MRVKSKSKFLQYSFSGIVFCFVVLSIALTAFVISYASTPVFTTTQLDSLVGKRIRLTATFFRDNSGLEWLDFDGERLSFTKSKESPTEFNEGDVVDVVGTLSRSHNFDIGSTYTIKIGSWAINKLAKKQVNSDTSDEQ